MGNLLELVKEKMLLERDILYTLNKYILWFSYSKKIVSSYTKEKLTYQKIDNYILFLQTIKYNDVQAIYNVTKHYKSLVLEDNEYKIEFTLINHNVEIEYKVKLSDTTYNYSIPNDDYIKFKGCVYNQLHDNMNMVLNNNIYTICKSYILND